MPSAPGGRGRAFAALVAMAYGPALRAQEAHPVIRCPSEYAMSVLTHEDIPGFMGSMTMVFPVKDPALYQGLDIGATVRVTLTGVPPDVVITAIERENP
jgi:Cu/Ag efflux protein CusF